MRIGIACDLRSDQEHDPSRPDDTLEEYDSEATVEAVSDALRSSGHEPVWLGGGRTFLEHALDASRRHEAIDLVFNLAEGRGSRSREAHVPAVCEMLALPHTGSDPLTLALCLDKALAKRVAASHGIDTPPWCLIDSVEAIDPAAFPALPAIAKLNAEGSSIGVRKNARCATHDVLRDRVKELLALYRSPVLVEHFIDGVEVTVAILGTGAGARIAEAMEVSPRGPADSAFVYSLEAKRNYHVEVDYHVPTRLPAGQITAVERCALSAYRALGCRDVGRVDLRLDGFGTPHLIEVNPLPGLHPQDGDLPLMWQRTGRTYASLIATIVAEALGRTPVTS